MQRGSDRIWVTERLKKAVLEEGEKTSVKRRVATPPCHVVSDCIRKAGGCVGLTVAITPTRTITKLKLCCVVRTAFSPGERSDQRTCPVSPVNVMLFRGGWVEGVFVELCVACALRVVENAGRPMCVLRLEEGCMRGSRKDGRRSAIASVGLYIAVIVAVDSCHVIEA